MAKLAKCECCGKVVDNDDVTDLSVVIKSSVPTEPSVKIFSCEKSDTCADCQERLLKPLEKFKEGYGRKRNAAKEPHDTKGAQNGDQSPGNDSQ